MIEYIFQRRTGLLAGGMGAVASMKRSATAIELLAHTGAIRVTSIAQTMASAARLERQIGRCACACRVAAAVVAR